MDATSPDVAAAAPLRRRPNMADVALRAGVSAQTVSRVSNQRSNVDPRTREKVLAAMADLGYRANSAARSLATGSSRTIGVIASTLATHGAQQIVDGVCEETARHGYGVTLIPLRAPSFDDVTATARAMVGRLDVDALVVGVASGLLERAVASLPVDVPVVLTDGGATTRFLTVDSDPGPGVRAAVEHLLAQGHRRIWHVAGPASSATARRRRDVWAQVLHEHGLPVPDPLPADWSSASGYETGLRIAAARPRPTAVLCANDQVALGLVRACADVGVRVPEDLSVVGFDDVEAGRYAVPRLSTVTHDIREVGRRAVRTLLLRLEPGSSPGPLGLVPTGFLDRQSTAPPRRG